MLVCFIDQFCLMKQNLIKVVVWGILIAQTLASEAAFRNFKSEMEGRIIALANSITGMLNHSYCNDEITNCSVKSYNLCEGSSEKWCNLEFPIHAKCSSVDGAYVSNFSSIRFPTLINLNTLTDDQRRFVCATATLESEFQKFDIERNKKYTIVYVGSIYGSFRQYPTSKEPDESGLCIEYDPRFRPWYVSATTGPKNVVILIDISGSMQFSKIINMRKATMKILQSFANVDFVGVIAFNQSAYPLVYTDIVRATHEVLTNLSVAIDNLEAGGNSNYEVAFNSAIQMFKNLGEDQYGAPCVNVENIIMLLSDGMPSRGETTSAGLINAIDTAKESMNLVLFTYTIGQTSQTNTTFMKELSCAYEGIMFHITDVTNLAATMRGYYQYISLGANISEPMWSEPYDDAFGFGTLFTVSMPIYYDTENFRRVIGVVGLDILYQKMLSFGLTEQQVVQNLISSSSNCLTEGLSPCEMEYYRSSSAKCDITNCSIVTSQSFCLNNQSSEIFKPPATTEEEYCCPGEFSQEQQKTDPGTTINILSILLAVFITLFFVLAVILAIIYIKKRKQKNQENNYRSDNRSSVEFKPPTSPLKSEKMNKINSIGSSPEMHLLPKVVQSPMELPRLELSRQNTESVDEDRQE